MLVMIFALIREYFHFGGMLFHYFINDLLLRRNEKSLMVYGTIGSSIALCLVTHPFFKVIINVVLIVCAADILPFVCKIHRAYFCCGIDWSSSSE